MYRVMLVDDEPLILAGIKTLVDWEALDCELMVSVRNGQQALEAMAVQCPDIAIVDINMPVLGGMELLKQAEHLYPATVFIVLTNLQEFELVRQSLRHKAVDYLVKTQLDSEMLSSCVEKAKKEAGLRQHLRQHALEHTTRNMNELRLLQESIRFLIASPDLPPEAAEAFQRAGVLKGYRMLSVLFVYPEHRFETVPPAQEQDQLFQWEAEVVDTLAKTCFSSAVTTACNAQNQAIYALIWQEFDAWEDQLLSFQKKLQTSSGDLTGVLPCILVSTLHSGIQSLAACRQELFAMQDAFYLTGEAFISCDHFVKPAYSPLGLKGLISSFQKELNEKDANGCASLLDRAIQRIEETVHEKSQAVWLCTELYFTVCEAIKEWPDSLAKEGVFSNSAIGYAQIRRLATRSDVVRFLSSVSNELQIMLQPNGSKHSIIIQQAQEFIHANIEKRIALQEIAKHVWLSPGYLSALFKKQCGETLIDYVNRHKVEAACELLKQGELLISQVSDQLSFENAYYFTRVFKRYMAMTPSEYQERKKGDVPLK